MFIPEREKELSTLFAKHFSDRQDRHEDDGRQRRRQVDLNDDEIIAKIRKAKNSTKFERLFDHGNASDYDYDESRADLALVSMLAFYSQDTEQLDRLVRRSALCRDKWLKRSDYRRLTIEAATKGLTETYRASSSSPSYRGDGGDEGKATLAVKSFRSIPKQHKPREFRVEGLVPERFVTTLYGDGGTAKSLIALSIGMACARGDEAWLGLRLKPCPVLYVDWELDEEEQGRRARQLARALGDDELPNDLYYLSGLGHPSQAVLPIALDACKKHDVGLVVIDSAGLAIEGDSTLNQDVIRFFGQLDRLRAEGITILLIDHQAKTGIGESYQQKTAFGSVYKGLLSRSRLQVEATERGPGSLRVVVRQNKANFSGHSDPFKITLAFDEEKITLKRETLAAEELTQERVLNVSDRVLLALSDSPAFTEDLVEPTGAVVGTVGNALTGLKRRGLVEVTGERRGNAREVRLSEEGERYVREYLNARGVSSPSPSTYKGNGDDDRKASVG